jgi:multidrug efflux pump subunit AcrA (membrane-fusion protein)
VSFLTSELDKEQLKAPPKTIVPAAAVTEVAGAKAVFRIDDGKVRIVPVTLGPPFGSGFELGSGPSAGTRVVKNPSKELRDGQAIKEKTGG